MFAGKLIASFLAFYAVISLTTSFPTKRSSQCQRNKAVRSLLQDALTLSQGLARRSSVLKQEVVNRHFFAVVAQVFEIFKRQVHKL